MERIVLMDRMLTVFPENKTISVSQGTNLLAALRSAGLAPDAPCGGNGKCGKCKVLVDGVESLACQVKLDRDMTVHLPQRAGLNVLQEGISPDSQVAPHKEGLLLAFDIGTTSVVCYLLDGETGRELGKSSMLSPQAVFGADVLSRIQAALTGQLDALKTAIREGMTQLIREVTQEPERVSLISVVGNPAMQQLFLGLSPQNLAEIPFAPVLTQAKRVPGGEIFPVCPNSTLLIIPDISGYIGADTMGCVLSTRLYEAEKLTLMVDIGTNGEMVLGNRERMIACSTAAGPALEGANIHFGMRGTQGAIDHVWLKDGTIRCSVIGGGTAKGICGSGLLDAVAVGLRLGLINKRGRILNEARTLPLTPEIYLTQEDIRQVQLAKGAIHAGIVLMAKQLGIELGQIDRVLLAGAFGSFLNPESACRMGLLPEELLSRIEAVGNAAGSGAKLLACDDRLLPLTQELTNKIEFLELASLPDFSRTFAKSMNFREETL